MNLTDFLSRVDALVDRAGPEQLAAFVHRSAVALPQDMREEFLKTLGEVCGGELHATAAEDVQSIRAELEAEAAKAETVLKEIGDGKRTLVGELNEDYDDWYDDMDEEFLYGDPENILDDLKEISALIHGCAEAKAYDLAEALGCRLLQLELCVDSEYRIGNLDLRSAEQKFEVDLELRRVALDTMLAAWCAGEKPEETIRRILCESSIPFLRLEDLLQYARSDLKDFPVLLRKLIGSLGADRSPEETALYQEAIGLLPSGEEQLACVRERAAEMPEGYLAILERKSLPAAFRFAAGMDGLERIPVSRRIRAEIALKTAALAIGLGKEPEVLESCWLRAFESDSNAENCLRVLLNDRNPAQRREQMREMLDRLPVKDHSFHLGSPYEPGFGRGENCPEQDMQYTVRFLLGDFDGVLQEGMRRENADDWFGTYIRDGMVLFLTALFSGETPGKGIQAMQEKLPYALGFQEERYRTGLPAQETQSVPDLCTECFRSWQKTISWPEEEKKRILDHLAGYVEKRMDSITADRRSKHYDECAAFLAAVGEVREDLGVQNAKRDLLYRYVLAYPRRSTLRSAMERFL